MFGPTTLRSVSPVRRKKAAKAIATRFLSRQDIIEELGLRNAVLGEAVVDEFPRYTRVTTRKYRVGERGVPVPDGQLHVCIDWRGRPVAVAATPNSLFGLDYSAGRVSGAELAANGVKFVCRYVTDGGAQLPNKELLRDEAADLTAHGIDIVSNYEYSGLMYGGKPQGTEDAKRALDIHIAAGGPEKARIYFSADYDAAPGDQLVINNYLEGTAEVLGGPENNGMYGGYWPLVRAFAAGVIHLQWQTEAWSGDNVAPGVNIFQQNRRGYLVLNGIECDYDVAYPTATGDFGQWNPSGSASGTSSLWTPDAQVTRVWHARQFPTTSAYEQDWIALG